MTQKEINELNALYAARAAQKAVRDMAKNVLPYLKAEVTKSVQHIAEVHYVFNNYRTYLLALHLDAAMRYSFGYCSLEEYREIKAFVEREDFKCWSGKEYEPWGKFHNTFFPQYQLTSDKSLLASELRGKTFKVTSVTAVSSRGVQSQVFLLE